MCCQSGAILPRCSYLLAYPLNYEYLCYMYWLNESHETRYEQHDTEGLPFSLSAPNDTTMTAIEILYGDK
jgi:hypothetical protein